jgi:hypothetical protein
MSLFFLTVALLKSSNKTKSHETTMSSFSTSEEKANAKRREEPADTLRKVCLCLEFLDSAERNGRK